MAVVADPPKHGKASGQPPKHEKEVEEPGLMVSRSEVMKKAPVADLGVAMLIPKGVRHKFEKVGDGKAYFVTVDTPPINPANNVWLEPAPKKSDQK